MTYQEQLKDPSWQEKRNIILSRDNYTCQNCENDSYHDKTSSGLVVSNSLDFVGKTHFGVEKWRFLVWDLQDNMLFRGSTNNPIFSTDKSYICYYRNRLVNGFKPSVLGLK